MFNLLIYDEDCYLFQIHVDKCVWVYLDLFASLLLLLFFLFFVMTPRFPSSQCHVFYSREIVIDLFS